MEYRKNIKNICLQMRFMMFGKDIFDAIVVTNLHQLFTIFGCHCCKVVSTTYSEYSKLYN